MFIFNIVFEILILICFRQKNLVKKERRKEKMKEEMKGGKKGEKERKVEKEFSVLQIGVNLLRMIILDVIENC